MRLMETGSGFNPIFLGEEHNINLPLLVGKTAMEALNGGQSFPFMHFSLVMNQSRKFLIYGANNVDRNFMKEVKRNNNDWHFDVRIGEENQVGNEYYRNNPWDRGHMVRRRDVCWGTTMDQAEKGNYDSFCWGNIVLQHSEINQGIWNEIEEWMLDYEENRLNKLSIFTGPVFTESDQEHCGTNQHSDCTVKIPAGFWKVMFYVDSLNVLHSAGFIVKQDEYWTDPVAGNLQLLESYQVPLRTISDLTGIEFEERLYHTSPLAQKATPKTVNEGIPTPEYYLIKNKDDLHLHRK